MGYYTDYTLSFNKLRKTRTGKLIPDVIDPDTLEKIELELTNLNVLEYDDSYGWYGNAKWYDHDNDMAVISGKFHGILFQLHGCGEDPEDLWNTYYYNGGIQHAPAQITYAEFSEDLVEDPLPF